MKFAAYLHDLFYKQMNIHTAKLNLIIMQPNQFTILLEFETDQILGNTWSRSLWEDNLLESLSKSLLMF